MFVGEQYLLQARLAVNDNHETVWVESYIHGHHPNKLQEAFSSCFNANANFIPPGVFG
jgi:hypothetical protein